MEQPPSSSRCVCDPSVDDWFQRLHRARSAVFDDAIRLSWLQVMSSIVVYVLVCSDTARSGIGVSQKVLQRKYSIIEPNQLLMGGPYAYPTSHLYRNVSSSNDTVHAWAYKLDTTSISWRSLAIFLHMPNFPDCLHYRSDCPASPDGAAGGAIYVRDVFAMTDSLVRRIAQEQQSLAPVGFALRCKANFIEHLHDFILPQVLWVPWRRINQAIYYHPELVRQRHFAICATKGPRPLQCDQLNANYQRTCVNKQHGGCVSTGLIWNDIHKRYLELQARFPSHHVDLTLLTSVGDIEYNTGGLLFEGYEDYDMTTVMRVLSCPQALNAGRLNTSSCMTELVDEYRYEGTIFHTNLTPWFGTIVLLRCTAQACHTMRLFTETSCRLPRHRLQSTAFIVSAR